MGQSQLSRKSTMRSSPGFSTRGLATRGRNAGRAHPLERRLQPVQIQIIQRDAGRAEFDGGIQLLGRAHQQMKGACPTWGGRTERRAGCMPALHRPASAGAGHRRPAPREPRLAPPAAAPPPPAAPGSAAMPARRARPPSPVPTPPARTACSPAAPAARAASPHRARDCRASPSGSGERTTTRALPTLHSVSSGCALARRGRARAPAVCAAAMAASR